jgi:hypothetical protein
MSVDSLLLGFTLTTTEMSMSAKTATLTTTPRTKKRIIMLVTTRNNDNTETTYGFDPQHKEEVIGFYTKAYWNQVIQGYRIQFADGSIFNIGAN